MSTRAQLMTDLVRVKLMLETEILRANALEVSTNVADSEAMIRLNTYRRSLADRYVQYGVQLAKLCDYYDLERATDVSCN